MFTPEVIERQKWFAFWDAPLNVPGKSGSNAAVGLPRKPDEIQKSWAKYDIAGCEVNNDGARIEVSFPGVTAGVFSGGLRYTVYRGTNLLRQEIIAKTDAPSVAYEYAAGLKGFAISDSTRLEWRDVARGWQHYLFGGALNQDPVAVKARKSCRATPDQLPCSLPRTSSSSLVRWNRIWGTTITARTAKPALRWVSARQSAKSLSSPME
jgi:hypothetical protein